MMTAPLCGNLRGFRKSSKLESSTTHDGRRFRHILPRLAACAALILIPAIALADEPAAAPLPATEATRTMRLPPGFVATLVAAEPEVVQPISFCIDDRGRLFVAEALNYGAWRPTGNDRIIILEDRDGDGRTETRTLFYEGLNYVTGVEVGFGGVWVMSPPTLYFIPDRNGDDVPDGPPEAVFDGFGHKESRHNLVNGFTWGPDGWLYAGHGRTTPSDVGRPGTPRDQRIHCDGGVCRIHPTRLVFENFADGTTNPWGVDFDDFGQCFVSNCVNPHLFHVLQGGHYEPWRNRPSSLYAYERLATCADHLHYPGNQPNAMRGETSETLAMGGGHAHCGTLVYLGDSFPQSYRNTVFMCNVHGRRVNNDILERHGSGYVARHGADFMIAGDPWFMGVTLRTGPQGSVYVSDWSDTGECHTYQPHRDNGRIYRLSYGSPPGVATDLAGRSDAELVQLQLHPNDWQVRHARRLLQERAAQAGWARTETHAALEEILRTHADTTRRLRALWALHVTGGLDASRTAALLDDSSEHVRAWAIQLLCEPVETGPEPQTLEKFALLAKTDASPVVRLYLACALQRLALDRRWEIARGLASRGEDAADQNLPLMIWYGMEPLVAIDPEQAIKLASATKIPLLRQLTARRFTDEVVGQSELGNFAHLISTLDEARDSAVQLDLLKGMREGLRGQKAVPMPAGWQAVYARLGRGADAAVREQAVAIALVFGDPQALVDLRNRAVSQSAPDNERLSALESLIASGNPDLAALLQDLLTDKAVRGAAVRGLAAVADPATPRKLLAVYPSLTAAEKQDAVATLSSRKAYALELLAGVENKTVPRTDISAYAARQLHALGDAQITDRLRIVWGDVRSTSPQKLMQLTTYKALLTPSFLGRGDLKNGRLIYSRTCQQCHVLYGEGGRIGPDLTGSNRANLDYLLSNILDPSAEISDDFRMSIVQTGNGRTITGLVVEKTPSRITIQTANERMTLAADDIEDMKASPLSIMPEGQLDVLTREQIRDLVAYLAAGMQVPLPVPDKTSEHPATP